MIPKGLIIWVESASSGRSVRTVLTESSRLAETNVRNPTVSLPDWLTICVPLSISLGYSYVMLGFSHGETQRCPLSSSWLRDGYGAEPGPLSQARMLSGTTWMRPLHRSVFIYLYRYATTKCGRAANVHALGRWRMLGLKNVTCDSVWTTSPCTRGKRVYTVYGQKSSPSIAKVREE